MRRKNLQVLLAFALCALFTISCTKTAVTQEENPFDREISNEYLTRALEAREVGDIHRAVELLSRALDRDPSNGAARREIAAIIDALESDSFFVKEDITRGAGFENPLSFVLTFRDGEEVLPVQNMPVRFGFRRGAGTLTERDITNDAGIARCYVGRIVEFSRSVVIEATVPHPLAEDEVIEKLTRVYTYGRLSPLEQPQRIFVHFREPRFARPGRIEMLLSGLVTAFEEAGFSDTETTYMEEPAIFTRAFGGDPPTIDLLSGPATAGTLMLCMVGAPRTTQQSSDFHRSLISVRLRFIEPESRVVTYEDELEGRGAGATADEAERRAFRRGLEAVLQSIDTHLTDMRRKYGF